MRKIIVLIICLVSVIALAGEIENNRPWDIDVTARVPKRLDFDRGEYVHLQPRLMRAGRPVDLSAAIDVGLRYWTEDMTTNYYYIAGTLHADTGRMDILFAPTNATAATSYRYNVVASATENTLYRGIGIINLAAVHGGDVVGNPTTYNDIDFATATIRNPGSAPWALDWEYQQADAALQVMIESNTAAIATNTELVGTGVAGVESNLQAHVTAADVKNASQDAAIAAAADGANMGGDVIGVSSQSVVVATRGRTFPTEADVPLDLEAIVWDSTLNGGLGGYRHGSVDLSGLQHEIDLLDQTKADQSEVDGVAGMVDGNDHVLMYVETFAETNWLETSPRIWEHLTNPTWSIVEGNVDAGDQLTLYADYGTCIVEFTQCVSRVECGTGKDHLIFVAETTAGPWWGYDAVKDNIPNTNMFAIKLYNGGADVSVDDMTVYTWEYPERVGYTRSFTGLFLESDAPDGSREYEVTNVKYVRDLAPGGDVTGTLGGGLTVDKIKGTDVEAGGIGTGKGLIYYESLDQLRYADLATQAELDAAAALKTDQTDHDTLADRVTATEAGGVTFGGDVTGIASSNTVNSFRNKALIHADPTDQQSYMFDAASDKWILRSILSSNIVYATGANVVEDFPADSAGFYRAAFDGGFIMPWIVDGVVVAYVSTDGITVPSGTLNIL